RRAAAAEADDDPGAVHARAVDVVAALEPHRGRLRAFDDVDPDLRALAVDRTEHGILRPVPEQPAEVHDADRRAHIRELAQDMGRDQDRRAAGRELLETAAQVAARYRVHAARRLVEQKQLRLV